MEFERGVGRLTGKIRQAVLGLALAGLLAGGGAGVVGLARESHTSASQGPAQASFTIPTTGTYTSAASDEPIPAAEHAAWSWGVSNSG